MTGCVTPHRPPPDRSGGPGTVVPGTDSEPLDRHLAALLRNVPRTPDLSLRASQAGFDRNFKC
jgi:hypothetical protein